MAIKGIESEKSNGVSEHRILPIAELISGSTASKMVFGNKKVSIFFIIKSILGITNYNNVPFFEL